MARPGKMMVQEKSKDFKGSIIRLFNNLKDWKIIMGLALMLAMLSAIFSLITPNKLSKLTDTISLGITPNVEVLEKVGLEIKNNLDYNNIQDKLVNIKDLDLTNEEKISLNNALEKFKESDEKDYLKIILNMPDKMLNYLLEDIKINNTYITKNEQIEFLNIMSKMGSEIKTEKSLKLIEELPKSIYDLVMPKMNMDKVKSIALIMASLYLMSALFNYIQSYSLTTVSNRFANKLRNDISKKINKLPLRYFDNHETGDVLSRVTNDVDTVAQNLNNNLATLVSSITLFLGSLIMMFITNWVMALTAIISSLIGFIFMFLILSKSQKYFNEKQTELGNINGFIEEIYSGHNVVKVYNGTKGANEDFDELNKKLYVANKKSQFLSGMMHPIMGFIGNFGYVMVCIVGALLVMNNKISFGVIVAFMIYVRMFTNPLSQIAQAMGGLQSTAAASERVFEFLDETEMSNQKDVKKHLNLSNAKGNIEFKNVKFGYDNRIVIKDFNVKVKPGDKIAIVGPTGAGKTTMVNLLMKFYEINYGDIIIDGMSTKDLTRENIHDLFVMVLQDTWLFDGTIRDNLKFNKENVSDREIWETLKVVGVDHFVKTLPGGLDYVIGDNDTISQGQKQLLTIARGMIKDAPFLILDEATSSVDTRTEELVQIAMDKLTEGKTSFIIAHRLSTIKNADLILVMNEGNIIEQGNHKELMKQKGFYSELYNSQFKNM